MFKRLLLGATLATAALAATPLLADPGHRHGQNTACSGENCPATARGGHGDRAGHGRMAQMHGGKNHQGQHGTRHGNGGAGCPMHAQPKAS